MTRDTQTKSAIKLRALVLENIDLAAIQFFQDNNVEVVSKEEALSEDELVNIIPNFNILCIRSKTKVTAKVLDVALHLFAIGCFCIGTDQVEVAIAAEKAVPTFNSPFANSRSVAEFALCEIIMLSRQLGDRNIEMHKQDWRKTSKDCHEIRGKKLGIIGYGHIGSQLSILAEAIGMQVIFHDIANVMPHGLAKPMNSLLEVLKEADFVSIHVPDSPSATTLISTNELSIMKKGSFLINASRGKVVDLLALEHALVSGPLAGAALDVFPEEPQANGPMDIQILSRLSKLPNIILTPHIGGSTVEAQKSIGLEVSYALINYMNTGSTIGAVNFPEVALRFKLKEKQCRLLNVHMNVPGVLNQINRILCNYNIIRQTCESSNDIAYLVTDFDNIVELDACRELLREVSLMKDSLCSRMVHAKHGYLFEDEE